MTPLLTTAEAAKHLGVSERTLRDWRAAGEGPSWIDLAPQGSSRSIPRYRVEDLDAWIAARANASAAQ